MDTVQIPDESKRYITFCLTILELTNDLLKKLLLGLIVAALFYGVNSLGVTRGTLCDREGLAVSLLPGLAHVGDKRKKLDLICIKNHPGNYGIYIHEIHIHVPCPSVSRVRQAACACLCFF